MYYLNSNKALEELRSNRDGLSQIEAQVRLKKYGKNEIAREKNNLFLNLFQTIFEYNGGDIISICYSIARDSNSQ